MLEKIKCGSFTPILNKVTVITRGGLSPSCITPLGFIFMNEHLKICVITQHLILDSVDGRNRFKKRQGFVKATS